jgi:anti-sigma regulatory factor (Ser/Thr protein kinase)
MDDGNLQIDFRPRADALSDVRRRLREWLRGIAASDTVIEELVLATDELCSNAVDAAPDGLVQLDVRWDGSAVHLAVSNAGNAPDDLSRPDPDDTASGPGVLTDRGRGLTIVRAFTDSLAIVNVDGRTVARAVRLLA